MNREDDMTDTRELIEQRIKRLRELVRVITARDFDATQFYMSIPADEDRDADLVISWAAKFIEQQVQEIESLVFQLAAAETSCNVKKARIAEVEGKLEESLNYAMTEGAKLQARIEELEGWKILKEKLSDSTMRSMIAENQELQDNIIRLNEVTIRLQARIDVLEGLLKVAACPNCGINKDGAYYDNMGKVCQCQWCHEVARIADMGEKG